MDEVAIWETPHSFASKGRHVFSYGLLLGQLRTILEPDGRERLAERWGDAEVATLADRIAPPAVAAPSIGPEVTVRDTSLRIGGVSLQPFILALATAANVGERVPEGWEENCRSFLRAAQAPRGFDYARRGDERVRVAAYRTLLDRIAVEYEHLVTRRPLLARCPLCGRVFVPRRQHRPERRCSGDLWLASTPPVHLEQCALLDAEVHRKRGQKRLATRHRRLLRAYGPDDPRVIDALQARAQWAKDHPPARRGRQSRPEPGYQPEGDKMSNRSAVP